MTQLLLWPRNIRTDEGTRLGPEDMAGEVEHSMSQPLHTLSHDSCKGSTVHCSLGVPMRLMVVILSLQNWLWITWSRSVR